MTIRAFATSLYWLTGTLLLLAGAAVVLTPTGLWPNNVEQFVIGFGDGDPLTLHLIQELGSALVFTGLVTFWFARHYEQSMPFHWSMTAFLALFGLAHLVDVHGTWRLGWDRMGDVVPVLIFVLVGVLRGRDSRRGQPRSA